MKEVKYFERQATVNRGPDVRPIWRWSGELSVEADQVMSCLRCTVMNYSFDIELLGSGTFVGKSYIV